MLSRFDTVTLFHYQLFVFNKTVNYRRGQLKQAFIHSYDCSAQYDKLSLISLICLSTIRDIACLRSLAVKLNILKDFWSALFNMRSFTSSLYWSTERITS